METAYALCLVLAERMENLSRDSKSLIGGRDAGYRLGKLGRYLGDLKWSVFTDEEVRSFKYALIRLKEVLYELDNLLDEWDLGILKPALLPSEAEAQEVCPSIPLLCCLISQERAIPGPTPDDITCRIEVLLEKLYVIFKEDYPFLLVEARIGRPPSSSLVSVHGRDVDRDTLLRKIGVKGNREVHSRSQIICIVGLAGIGKTALAELVYNDSRLMDSYPFRIWIHVLDYDDPVSIAQDIIWQVNGDVPRVSELETLLLHLRDSLLGKRYLLVLDDVRVQDYYKCDFLKRYLNFGRGDGGTVLVTTRNQGVATMMGTSVMYRLGQLSDESCWSILSDIALYDKKDQLEKFKDIGMKIAKKCNGIPHTAIELGKLLYFQCSLEVWEGVMKKQMWELNELSEDIFGPLLSTYHSFHLAIRCCFSYCGIIPIGSEVYSKKLIRCWSAQGYLLRSFWGRHELSGRDFLNELAMHSLFQEVAQDEFERIIMCKIYDIVLDCAHFLRKNAVSDIIGTTCQACGTSLVSHVKEYRSLFFQESPPTYICDCLQGLRVLSLRDCGLERIPANMVKLIHLRFLDMSYNQGLCEEDLKIVCALYHLETLFLSSCGLQWIPMEIGDLLQLSHLDLSFNSCLTELPESICNLLELRTLELDECEALSELPQVIHGLKNLTHLHNLHTKHSCPQGLGQLTSLRTLNEFSGKLSVLKRLNRLSGSLQLRIPESCGLEDVVEAKEAELYKKVSILELDILFEEEIDETISMGVLDGLQPHLDVRYMNIELYGGSKLPGWISSPFNGVRQIELKQCNNLLSLPALGKLPLLEEVTVQEMDGLQCVGREFLGLTTGTGDQDIASSSLSTIASNNVIAFPELKALTFYECPNWVVWEDITAEEEESANVLIMPRLKNLEVVACGGLAVLPHCLLRKMVALEELDIYNSDQLIEVYEDKKGSEWSSISQIRQVRFD